ncbi:hypothetical protein WOLCODRAFT_161967 [Wolfiporia cocos MD-104 SS10]|uniref:Uncharacterized protein n=1 Tax=Wolfiporia cocos (strain MD-104) TaxID=742152 RepID=A0A2H3JCG0_WOLCO|nr:hypothetical protein WOLCODRAFT_161967 [Wolfiporia cocos MD-104 SS10]
MGDCPWVSPVFLPFSSRTRTQPQPCIGLLRENRLDCLRYSRCTQDDTRVFAPHASPHTTRDQKEGQARCVCPSKAAGRLRSASPQLQNIRARRRIYILVLIRELRETTPSESQVDWPDARGPIPAHVRKSPSAVDVYDCGSVGEN